MSHLQNLRARIKSVQATEKITSAMKLVAAAKLRAAHQRVDAARPYAEILSHILRNLSHIESDLLLPPLMTGRLKQERYLLVLLTSDRGLCGSFNTLLIKETKRFIEELEAGGKKAQLVCIGKQGLALLERDYKGYIFKSYPDFSNPTLNQVEALGEFLLDTFYREQFDACFLGYYKFFSAMKTSFNWQQFIPLRPLKEEGSKKPSLVKTEGAHMPAIYEFEPNPQKILDFLIPHHLTIQLQQAFLENTASEQGSRMLAMDNATRNAKEMLRKLQIQYNRTRQMVITTELTEIISGAEALKKNY